MKKAMFFLIILLVVLILIWKGRQVNSSKLKVGPSVVEIELADTPTKREQGLSDRKSLCENCGLLFLFDQPGIYPFWMRRMSFDIDVLWIRNGGVAEITYGAQAPPKFSLTPERCKAGKGECLNEEWQKPKTFYQSQVPVDMVLEVNTGWTEKNGVKVGDKIELLR